MSSTTRTARILSRNSRPKSEGSAGFAERAMATVRAQPRSSTPLSLAIASIAGKSPFASFSWTRRHSSALHAKVPVIQHYQGVCHLYVDEGADHGLAVVDVKV